MENYKTQDFYLTAFLMSKDCILRDSYKVAKNKTEFVFDNNGKLKDLVEKYYSMQAKIEVMNFTSKLRILKSIVHSSSYQPQNEETNYDFDQQNRSSE